MTLELKAEDERIIARGVDAGVISGAADVVQLGVEVVRQRLEDRAALPEFASHSEWGARLRHWIEGHERVAPWLSDEAVSRESIYVSNYDLASLELSSPAATRSSLIYR